MRLNKITTNNLEQRILNIIQHEINQNPSQAPIFYLEGGHYDPRYAVTDFAINSLHHSLRIANNAILQHKRNLKIALGILIDDLGLQCGDDSCEISIADTILAEGSEGEGSLPNALEAVLAQYQIVKRDRLIIQGERTCKNRGIQTLRKVMAQHAKSPLAKLKTEETGALQKIYFVNENEQRVLLAESKSKDVWTAKCPVIMAQHYSDVFKKVTKLHPQTHSVHIIDFSETEDYNKVINGADVAIQLLLRGDQTENKSVTITNIFLSEFGDEDYILHTTTNNVSALEDAL